jgi:NADH-quinone oxidoreductase subunit M
MNSLLLIIIILLGGAILAFLANRILPVLSGIVSFLSIGASALIFFLQVHASDVYSFKVMDNLTLSWGVNAYSWVFAAMVLGLAVFVSLYAIAFMQGKDRLGYFFFNFTLTIMAMLGIVFSKDWISLFIFWEIMTWSSFLIVIYAGISEGRVGTKYMIFSAIGGYSMLMAILVSNHLIGSFQIADLVNGFANLSVGNQALIGILLMVAFGVKSAVMPLHVWAPRAYSDSPMAFTAIFSGLLSKMGVFGMGILLISVFAQSSIGNTWIFSDVLAWLGAITSVIATFYAVIQKDAKRLLAYSSIAQLGYIIVGLAIGTKLSVMAAIFLAVVHAIFKGTLFMVVGAVERQAGTTNMEELGALIRKMPWTFMAALFSIIALAGVPPLGGFVGKWMLYESMITSDFSNHYFLVIMVFLSSTAAFLYSYRFLFGLFLGQEEPEWDHVKEAPALMVIPMVILSLLLLVIGAFPGLLFEPIANAMGYLGMGDVNWDMTVLHNIWGDSVHLDYIWTTILIMFVIGALFLTFKNRKNTRYVTTKDIHTSGEIPEEWENLTFSVNFYQPFQRAIAPVLKRQIDYYYNRLGEGLESLFGFIRKIYTGNGQTYATYVIIFLVILILIGESIFK